MSYSLGQRPRAPGLLSTIQIRTLLRPTLTYVPLNDSHLIGQGPAELVLLVIATMGASVAALFAIICFFHTRQLPNALTARGATQILRAETDIVRVAIEDQTRGLRHQLGQSLKGFQDLTLAAFGALRDGIDAQVRGFGERLDGGIKTVDERAAAIPTKLNDEMVQMRSEANTNREALRGLIEQKLDHSVGQQTETSKILRDELGGNFHRLGIRVSDSLIESGQIQKERLENVTGALTGLTEKLEKAQEGLRTTVGAALEKLRSDNAEKLEQMRISFDEKL
jgi:DNA recombination protein RmuC